MSGVNPEEATVVSTDEEGVDNAFSTEEWTAVQAHAALLAAKHEDAQIVELPNIGHILVISGMDDDK